MPVTDEEIRKRLNELLETVDLETTSERKLREMLEGEFKEDLKDRKSTLREEIQNYLDKQQEDGENGNDEGADDDEEDYDDKPAAAAKKGSKPRQSHHFGSILSPELQEFLGVESMPRTQVVKAIWVYIKEHNLQDPKNKRRIIPDEKLGKVLPRTDMMKMNKHLSKHVYTEDQFDYDEEDVPPKPKAKAKPAARKTAAPATKKPANGTKAKRKPAAKDDDTDEDEDADMDEDAAPKKKRRKPAADTGGGSLLSPEMQAFLGVERMNRFQVVKAIWAYVKENDLQDPNDRRSILPDAKLGKILQAPVTAFSLNKQLSKHFVKTS